MKLEQLYSLIDQQFVSEKSSIAQADHNQYVFKVATKATKPQVKQAIEKLFNVKVQAVQVLNVKAKTRRFGQIQGTKKAWKKAYISLAPGHTIELTTAQG